MKVFGVCLVKGLGKELDGLVGFLEFFVKETVLFFEIFNQTHLGVVILDGLV